MQRHGHAAEYRHKNAQSRHQPAAQGIDAVAFLNGHQVAEHGLPLAAVRAEKAHGQAHKHEKQNHAAAAHPGNQAFQHEHDPAQQQQRHGHGLGVAATVGKHTHRHQQRHGHRAAHRLNQADLGIRGPQIGGKKVIAEGLDRGGELQQQALQGEKHHHLKIPRRPRAASIPEKALQFIAH